MDLSVVVVTFNSAPCVGDCLRSVQTHLPGAELIVIDNDSSDETVETVAAAAPHARLVRNASNLGFGRACNIGAAAATRSHVLFLNPDVVVATASPTALAELFALRPFGLAAPASAHRSGGLMGAQPDRHWLRDWFDHTLAGLKPRELRTRPTRRCRRAKKTWVSGAMLLADRSEFLELGGFDSRFFLYYEDRDLSARYRSAGLPIRETSELAGSHVGTRSSRADELRVQPLGWAFLGWIEYLYLHEGERVARLAARTALTTLRTMSGLLGAAQFVPLSRTERKHRQVSELIRFVESHARRPADDEEDTFCADAGRVLTTLL